MTENIPHLQVVAGNPSPEELAIVVAVLQAAASAAKQTAETSRRVANWHRNQSVLRAPIQPGHGQWVASTRRGLN